MIDKILKIFGLVTYRRARHINRETARLLCRSIAGYAAKDFGVPPNPVAEEETVHWADDCFDQMIDHQDAKAELVGAWELY